MIFICIFRSHLTTFGLGSKLERLYETIMNTSCHHGLLATPTGWLAGFGRIGWISYKLEPSTELDASGESGSLAEHPPNANTGVSCYSSLKHARRS